MHKLTLTLTLLLTLYGPITVRPTLTDPRATFIEKSVLCVDTLMRGYLQYIEITYRKSIDNYSKLVICANGVCAIRTYV